MHNRAPGLRALVVFIAVVTAFIARPSGQPQHAPTPARSTDHVVLISIDGFMTLSPFRSQGLLVRPSLELAFGEVTTLFGLHFDFLVGLPGVKATTRWAPYFGAGPSFSFSHRGVNEEEFLSGNPPPATGTEEEEDRFDFSQYDWDAGFNFIVGSGRVSRESCSWACSMWLL